MLPCWNDKARQRPEFSTIVSQLAEFLGQEEGKVKAVVGPQSENPEASNMEGMMSRKGKLNTKKRLKRLRRARMQASRKNSEDSLSLENRTQNESTTGNVLFTTDNVNDADPPMRMNSLSDGSSSGNEYVSLLDITTSTLMAPDFEFRIPLPPPVKPKEIKLTDKTAPGDPE